MARRSSRPGYRSTRYPSACIVVTQRTVGARQPGNLWERLPAKILIWCGETMDLQNVILYIY